MMHVSTVKAIFCETLSNIPVKTEDVVGCRKRVKIMRSAEVTSISFFRHSALYPGSR